MALKTSLTERLNAFMRGDATAVDALLSEVLPKLHEIAVRELKRERYVAPLSKTELIHEVGLSTLAKGGQIRDQGHFYALASLAMRRVLVDLARKRLAGRRGGGEANVPLDENGALLGAPVRDAQQIVEIGILMERLEAKDPDAARMVDMHYFSGFTLEEIAAETGLTFRQVRSRWDRAEAAQTHVACRGTRWAPEPIADTRPSPRMTRGRTLTPPTACGSTPPTGADPAGAANPGRAQTSPALRRQQFPQLPSGKHLDRKLGQAVNVA